jgi:hypothetical protein
MSFEFRWSPAGILFSKRPMQCLRPLALLCRRAALSTAPVPSSGGAISRFIPLTPAHLQAALLADAGLTPAMTARLERLAPAMRLGAATGSAAMLDQLKILYDGMDPDKDTLHADRKECSQKGVFFSPTTTNFLHQPRRRPWRRRSGASSTSCWTS